MFITTLAVTFPSTCIGILFDDRVIPARFLIRRVARFACGKLATIGDACCESIISATVGLGALLGQRIARRTRFKGTILALVCVQEEISTAVYLGALLRVGIAFWAIREVAVVGRISVEDRSLPTSEGI